MFKLQEKIGYTFKDASILRTAMTHSSYANESRDKRIECNERIEFLGDSVLSLITSDYIYLQYRQTPEGELTKIRASVVCEQALFEVANSIGLSEHILLGKGEEAGGGRNRPSILADAMEALIGALYLDGGFEVAQKFVLTYLKPKIALAAKGKTFRDYKTMLQEIVQKSKEEVLSYHLVSESGPDHNKHFEVEVLLNSNVFAKGEGRSKKEAEQMAARSALQLMGEII